ncbi:VapE domain-containing protein [Ralstonia mannitolilytica]|uniref:VapE domain-containing protein n=1 Tax=Ralstonia mannitolilytica TaxID=105219 RepID=UPI0026EAE6D3|nr:VapE domain-containing protein [Ralstonia mannitolilytica]
MTALALRDDDVIRQFLEAMAAAGLRTSAPIEADGDMHRVHIEGDRKGTRNGWYVLHMNGVPAGGFGNWRTGTKATWCANGADTLTPGERADIDARIEDARKRREAEERERQKAAAKRAQVLWDAADEADGSHPYLTRKNVSAHGLRVAPWALTKRDGETFKTIDSALLVPIRSVTGKLTSLQAIFPAVDDYMGRDKDMLRDGLKKGCFHTIGTIGDGPIAICEGYATGATVHEATGWTVAVAFDAYNLRAVAEALRQAHPRNEIIFCADNDQWTHAPVENPGVTKASEAAKLLRCRVIVPAFADLTSKPTDFNDLAECEGLDAVRRQLIGDETLPVPANDNALRPANPFEAIELLARHGITLAVNSRQEPYHNLDNCIAVLQGHPRFTGRIWYDTFHQEIMTTWDCEHPRQWVDADRLRVATVFQRDFGLAKFGDEVVEKAAIAVAHADQRDELRDWLKSLRWDGTPRLDGWLQRAVGAPSDEYHNAIGRNFILAMVARGLVPGCKADTMPVFEGAQGAGKSRLLAILGGSYYAELTESLDTKDFFVVIQGKWLVEIAELDAFRRTDVTRIKQVLSSQQDRCRLPYAKRAMDLPRRVVFAGTTNEHEYLRDHTGARRFWPLKVARIDHDWLQVNRQQLFAEAVERFKAGATWWDVPLEAAKEQTEARRETDAWEPAIAEWCIGHREVLVSDVLAGIGVELAARPARRDRATQPMRPGWRPHHRGNAARQGHCNQG